MLSEFSILATVPDKMHPIFVVKVLRPRPPPDFRISWVANLALERLNFVLIKIQMRGTRRDRLESRRERVVEEPQATGTAYPSERIRGNHCPENGRHP